MVDVLCPECGTEMVQSDQGWGHDENGEPTIIEVVLECPFCEYWELRYED